MCGIAGFYTQTIPVARRIDMLSDLLESIEHRGKEATGLGWFDAVEGNDTPLIFTHKEPIPATTFIKTERINVVNAACSGLVIAHTRFPTKGDKAKPVNNHPIDHNWVVGVHNGTVSNDDDLFKDLPTKRIGEVDSEAIFASLSAAVVGTVPGSDERVAAMAKSLEKIEGSMALAFYIKDEPGILYLARGRSSPLFTTISENGDLIFASTMTAIDDAVKMSGMPFNKWYKPEQMNEGIIARYDGKDTTHFEKFTPAPFTRRAVHHDWDDYDYWQGRSGHRAVHHVTPGPFTMLDHWFKQRPEFYVTTWEEGDDGKPVDDRVEDVLTDAGLWDLVNDEGLGWFMGLFDADEQVDAIADLLPEMFRRPPLAKDQPSAWRQMQPVIEGAIDSLVRLFENVHDKRTIDQVLTAAYRDLATILPYEQVQWKLVGPDEKHHVGWLVAHTRHGKFPNHKVIVGAPAKGGSVQLHMLPNYQVKPVDDEPTSLHKERLKYIERLAFEKVYRKEIDVDWEPPWCYDFEALPFMFSEQHGNADVGADMDVDDEDLGSITDLGQTAVAVVANLRPVEQQAEVKEIIDRSGKPDSGETPVFDWEHTDNLDLAQFDAEVADITARLADAAIEGAGVHFDEERGVYVVEPRETTDPEETA